MGTRRNPVSPEAGCSRGFKLSVARLAAAGEGWGMQRAWWIAGGLWLSAGLVQASEPGFSKSVAAEDFAAAGLGKLSPEELARLDALVQQFKAGPKRASTAAVAAGPKTATEPRTSSRAITVAPGTEVRYASVESRIAGEFRGWQSNTILRLENGQRWKVLPGQNYSGPAVNSPAARIVPGMLGTFWLTVEGVKVRVKVEPVE